MARLELGRIEKTVGISGKAVVVADTVRTEIERVRR